jgi:hypothetical protein
MEEKDKDNNRDLLLKKNLTCTVCGARAYGYNFDQISCESCKGKIKQNIE